MKRPKGEGTVRDRGEHAPPGSRFEARMPGRGGKSFYGATREDALARRREYEEKLRGGIDPEAGKSTLQEYLKLWLENNVRVNVRRPTYEHHERMVRNHIIPTLGKLKLQDLKADHVQTLHARKFDAGYALSTRRHIHTTLSAALKQAVRFGHLPSNPAAGVGVPKGAAPVLDEEDLPDPDMRILDGEQTRRLLRAAADGSDRLGALYVLAVTTGMRQGELLGLSWSHVDLKAGLVRVRRSLVLAKGGFSFAPPKTERSRRTIELRSEAVEALREHRKRQLEEIVRYEGVWKDQGLVFATTVGSPIRRQNLQRRSFKPLLERAGLPDIRFHDLRHTFATLMLRSPTADINTVSKMLGHSSVKVTLDVYAHVMPGMQKQALKGLDSLFS
jgi:integrase